MALIDTLKSTEFFGGLERNYLRKVANLCRGYSYRVGQIIFKEGNDAEEMYVLVDGRVALEMEVHPVPSRPSIPTAVEVITEGETFGWSALVEPYIYTLSARCMTHCRVLAVNGDVLREVMADDNALGYELTKRLTNIISTRLMHTRLRLNNGVGLVLMSNELEVSGKSAARI